MPHLFVEGAWEASAEPVFDVRAEPDGDGGFTLFDGDHVINTQAWDLASVDRRGIIEFDFSSLPDEAIITSASVTFDVEVLTSDSTTGGPEPRIFGYAGNGSADSADAEQLDRLLGVGETVTDLSTSTIDLDADALNELLAQSSILGLVVLGSQDANQFGFTSLEGPAFGRGPAPTLHVEFVVPEPSSAACLALALLPFCVRRRNRQTNRR